MADSDRSIFGPGSAGGILGVSRGTPTTITPEVVTDGTRIVPTDWAFVDLYNKPGAGAVGGGPGKGGWGVTEAGWYQYQFDLNINLTAGSDPLPKFIHFYFNAPYVDPGWGGSAWDLTCHEVNAGQSNFGARTSYGVLQSLPTPVFYSPGVADTGTDTDGNAAFLGLDWDGDATAPFLIYGGIIATATRLA